MKNVFIDTHAHIYLEQFEEDVNEVIGKSLEQGVSKIYMPNVDSTTIDKMLKLEDENRGVCYSMMGLHPCSVKENYEVELQLVEEWLDKRKFSAVGEIGTDLYWDKTFWEQQKEAFTFQLQLAVKHDLPVVIHCRESLDETIELVRAFGSSDLRGIFHCFTGTINQAKAIEEMGFMLGIGGVLTFKNSGLDKVVGQINPEHIVLETDSPYLTPAPHRGKRNDPSYLAIIAERLAEIRGVGINEISEITYANSMKIFAENK